MEFKGTKGKWFLAKNSNFFGGDDNYQNISAGCRYYCDEEPNEGFSITGFLSKENALLISKAPEMLEMLKKIDASLDYLYSIDEKNEVFDGVNVFELKQLIKEATEINEPKNGDSITNNFY